MLEFMSHDNEQNQLNENISQPIEKQPVDMKSTDDLEFGDISEQPGHEKNHYEFVVESVFRDFKNLFEKNYTDDIEHVKRKDIFRHNMR